MLPVPVAVMVARQMRAARQHLLAARHLAEEHGVPVAQPRLGDKEPSLLAGVMTSTTKAVWGPCMSGFLVVRRGRKGSTLLIAVKVQP